MSNLLQVINAYKNFGAREIFKNISFSINEAEHIGLIGANGAGKTTLFKALIGELDFDQGEIIKTRRLKLGYLSQEDDWDLTQTVIEYTSSQSELPEWEVKQLGRGLGFDDKKLDTEIQKLSGGYRMRTQLLAALTKLPNLLLLDEPTNYLDLESLLVLETFLKNYKGAFLLISHDREFLKKVCDSTLEIENAEVTKFSGHIDDYFEQKSLIQNQLQKQIINQQNKRKEILRFIERFGAKATKAKQAQSRAKMLSKMQEISVNSLPVKAKIKLPKPQHTGRIVLKLEAVDVGYGSTTVLKNINMNIERGDHLGIVGVNGAGKTTLLKTLAGELTALKGEIEKAIGVEISYFAQHSVEVLNKNDTVLQSLQCLAHPDTLPQEILNMAGALLFSKDDCEKKVSVLSGGEKTRICLGGVLLSKKPVIVLDEPTNHLDFMTVETLTQALCQFEGTLIVVSHDRSFIGRVSKKIIQIDSGEVSVYPGGYQDYVWSLEKGVLSERNGVKNDNPVDVSVNKEVKRSNTKINFKDTQKKINQIEKKMEKLDRKLKNLIIEMSGLEANSRAMEYKKIEEEKRILEEEWLDLSEKIQS